MTGPLPQTLRAALLTLFTLGSATSLAQTYDVTAHIDLVRRTPQPSHPGSSDVVVWLSPLDPAATPLPASRGNFVLTQKDKQFTPHLLVVPVGSSVDFPNLDPFFHNVFSLFNGKRFDLGLYEGHSHRAVLFDREGVSFIFCNIHPDMAAVVVSLSTPYYAVSQPNGNILLHNIPAGRYRLNIWAENTPVPRLNELSRTVEIGPQHTQLGTLHLETTADTTHHTNKFGEPYKPTPRDPY